MSAFEMSEAHLCESFFRSAAGPGGQYVNKTSNGVRLAYSLCSGCGLPEDAVERLKQMAGDRIVRDSFVIEVSDTRSLNRNRVLARERLLEWIEKALVVPKKRKNTKPTRASVQRRLEKKRRRGELKSERTRKVFED